jgi:hypothetical protein
MERLITSHEPRSKIEIMHATIPRKSYREDPARHKPLSYHWRVKHEELHDLIPHAPVYKDEGLQAASDSMLCDLIQVARSKTPDRRISYSRRMAWYSNGDRYRGSEYTYRNVLSSVEGLKTAGLIVDEDRRLPGTVNNRDASGHGIQSSFRATPELVGFKPPKIWRARKNEIIVLKDGDKNLVGYRDTERTSRMRKKLAAYNEIILGTDIRFDKPGVEIVDGIAHLTDQHSVYLDMKESYRVFNNEVWTDGGRLYGTCWQQMDSEERSFILIDGETVTEIDHDQIHPRFCYAHAGAEYEGDAYNIPGWNRSKAERDLVKIGWNILLNASGYVEALKAFTHKIGCEVTARECLRDIRAAHPKIAHLFHSGIGIKLQNLDAEMAMEVVEHFTIKHGVPCLSVHDSFIVASSHKGDLAVCMAEVMKKGLARVGNYVKKSKVSRVSIPHMEALSSSPLPEGALGGSSCSESESRLEAHNESLNPKPNTPASVVELHTRNTVDSDSTHSNTAGDHTDIPRLFNRRPSNPNTKTDDTANPEKKAMECNGDDDLVLDASDLPEDALRVVSTDPAMESAFVAMLADETNAEEQRPRDMKIHFKKLADRQTAAAARSEQETPEEKRKRLYPWLRSGETKTADSIRDEQFRRERLTQARRQG